MAKVKSKIRATVDGLAIVYRPTSELVPYLHNAKRHESEQIDQIVDSIREFGFVNPILLDGSAGVIAGHGRLMAARRMAMSSVPTIELSHLTDEQKRAYVIADNRLAEVHSGWDDEKLAFEFEALTLTGADLTITGFTDDEIDGILQLKPELDEKEKSTDFIKMTRILVSVPAGAELALMDTALKEVEEQGGTVDYAGN